MLCFVKRNRLAVLLAAIAILLIAGGVLAALWQSFEAQRQQQIAEQRFAQVRKIANSLILDYHDEIAKLQGATKLREKLATDAVNYLNAVSSEKTDDTELLQETAIAYRKIADVQGLPYGENLGKLDEALQNYEKSVVLLENAQRLAPENPAVKDELIESYRSFAMAANHSGNKEQAIALLKEAVAVGELLDSSADNNLDRQISFLTLKTIVVDISDDDKAVKLENYRRAADDAQALYKIAPPSEDLLRLMVGITQRVGTLSEAVGDDEEKKNNAETARGHYSQALDFHSQTLRYSEMLSAVDSQTVLNKQSFMAAYANIASVLSLLGENGKALENIEKAESIIREIKTDDAGNRAIMLFEVDVLSIKQRILARGGDLPAALKNAKTAFEIAENSYQSDPNNVEALSWIIRMSGTTADIFDEQKKASEAENYRQISRRYEKQYEGQVR